MNHAYRIIKQLAFVSMLMGIGCTYPSQSGRWNGDLVEVKTYDPSGNEYRITGIQISDGTEVRDPYSGLIRAQIPAILVDGQGHTTLFDASRQSVMVAVHGRMRFDFTRTPDGKQTLHGSPVRPDEPAQGWVIRVSEMYEQEKTTGSSQEPLTK